MIVSPDGQHACLPPNFIRFIASVRSTPVRKIRDLFDQLGHIENSEDLAEAYGSGWITGLAT